MATIVTRVGKGDPLTNAEVDANFTNLNNELVTKLAAGSNLSDLDSASTARTNLGLGNVENKSAATILSELSGATVAAALGFTPLTSAEIAAGYQALDADLTAIAGLSGTSGFLKKTGTNTWALDTSTYLTEITSSLVTTALGFTPYSNANPSGYITSAALSGYLTSSAAAAAYQPLDADLTAIAALTGTAGFLKSDGSGTWSVDSSTYLTTAAATAGYLPLSGGTLSGGLTVTGNLLLAPNAGASRTIGFSGGTDTTLVLQGGGTSGSGANLELTRDYLAYLDANTIQLRSVDGATTFLTVNSSALTLGVGAVFNKGYTETPYAVVDAPGVALSPTNGSVQTWTLGDNRVPTLGTWAAGQSITLHVNDTASVYTVDWATSMSVVWVNGTAPGLTPGGGYTVIVLWKLGTTIYGMCPGQVA